MDRMILHSDINACYASIELLRHPELPLSDALSHQLAAGGADLRLRPEIMAGLSLFSQYARERRAGAPRWSEWLARHDG